MCRLDPIVNLPSRIADKIDTTYGILARSTKSRLEVKTRMLYGARALGVIRINCLDNELPTACDADFLPAAHRY